MDCMNNALKTNGHSEDAQQPLRDYEELKFQLATLGRAVIAASPTPRDPAVDREYQTLVRRLAEDQFNLAVVGQFSRGKTSLMNAVLGMDRLPTGIVPLTSVITAVSYGSSEAALVEYENSGLRHEIRLTELPTYVTQQGNPGNEKRIRAVEVQLPSEILRRGFRFIDTPGLGSAVAANTATTERYLPDADAIVFVTSTEAPLSQLEVDYLHCIRRLVQKVFVIVNKMDLVSDRDKQQVLDFVRGRLSQESLGDLPLYAVSARDALRFKLNRQTESLEASGLGRFERDLVDFLVTDRFRDFLVQNCERLMRIATEVGVDNPEVLGSIAELRARVVGRDPRDARHDVTVLANASGLRRSCPICQEAAGTGANFLAKYQYEISYELKAQRRHAANRGFCSFHTWQYEQLASPRGVCSAYPPLIQFISRGLMQATSAGEVISAVEAVQPARDHCPACQVQRETVHAALQRLTESAQEFDGIVCLPHLRLLVPLVDSNTARALVMRHAQLLQRIGEDMHRFAMKQDGLRRDLITEEERQSYRQSLALIAGDRRLPMSAQEVWIVR